MALELEQYLKELCEQSQPALDLYDRLERVRVSAETIWQEQRLKWFTDHKAATHSRYIIGHLSEILGQLQNTPQGLTPYELYILLAACYLHDIGMQNFQDDKGSGVEHFTEEDYKRIRDNHPKTSRDLIIKRTLSRGRDDFRIDLDDDPQYLVPIALVSQGHGSGFFTETIEEIQDLPHHPGNKPLRGGLLTALLLMGDELDLHERRATFPREFALSPMSLLHHYIHHYVASVRVIEGHTPKHRRIRLVLEFPMDSDDYRSYVRNWITTKLRRQCELTNPIIERLTQGELLWDNKIEVIEKIDKYGVRRSFLETDQTVMALHELKCEVIMSQTVNRNKFVSSFLDMLNQSRQSFQAIQVIDQENSDWSHLVKWLRTYCLTRNASLIHIAFYQSIGHGPIDILHLLSNDLANVGWLCSNYNRARSSVNESQYDALNILAEAFIADLQAYAEVFPLILLLERIDKAEADTVSWMEKYFLPKLSEQNTRSLVIYTKSDTMRIKETVSSQPVVLSPFTKAQIIAHLHFQHGFSSEKAENEGNILFSSSGGTPLNVYTALSVMQRQGIDIL